ncbi:MAG TPA: cytochrome c biogenesis protein CcsA, partial [Thermodesulfobacteriota bacterium]|nr:cytochrome c biogenesis protein CcsA [Thermodesulfobacteriota bacterium]
MNEQTIIGSWMSAASISLIGFYGALGAYGLSVLAAWLQKHRISVMIFGIGWLAHSVSQLARGWYLGFFFPNPIVHELTFLPWCLAALGLGLRTVRTDTRMLRQAVMLVFVFSLVTMLFPKGVLAPFPKNQTIFSPLFFACEVLAHACFILGAWFGLLYLLRKSDSRLFHSLVIWGFVFYSVSQIIGAIWAYLGWGSPFHWSDRHLGSACLWCYYAAYVHLSFVAQWDLRKRAGIAALGAILAILFTANYQLFELRMLITGG